MPLSARRLQPFSASASSLGLSETLIPLFNSFPVAQFNLLLTVYSCNSLHQRQIPSARVSLFHFPLLMIPHARLLPYVYYFNTTPNLSTNPCSLVLTVHSIVIGYCSECHKHYTWQASIRKVLVVTPFVVEQLTPPTRQVYHGLILCEWGDRRATQSKDTFPSLPTIHYYSLSLSATPSAWPINLRHIILYTYPTSTTPSLILGSPFGESARRTGAASGLQVMFPHYSFILVEKCDD